MPGLAQPTGNHQIVTSRMCKCDSIPLPGRQNILLNLTRRQASPQLHGAGTVSIHIFSFYSRRVRSHGTGSAGMLQNLKACLLTGIILYPSDITIVAEIQKNSIVPN